MLTQLNRESLLVMYVADELSAEDRSAVERMLEADSNLRDELNRLNVSIQAFESGMSRLDMALLPLEPWVVRRVGVAMRQKLALQAKGIEKTQMPSLQRSRSAWWVYPTVGAAAVGLAMLGWWGRQPASPLKVDPTNSPIVMNIQHPPKPDRNDNFDSSGVVTEELIPDDLVRGIDQANPVHSAKNDASLEAAEQQLAELTSSQFGLMPSNFSFRDGNDQ